MSASLSLLDEMRSLRVGKRFDVRTLRDRIHDAFDHTDNFEERGVILAAFTALMDCVERDLQDKTAQRGDIEEFRKSRDQDYCLLLTKELLDGENANPILLERVTRREVYAGRMSPNHKLRQLALAGMALGRPTSTRLRETITGKVARWKRSFGTPRMAHKDDHGLAAAGAIETRSFQRGENERRRGKGSAREARLSDLHQSIWLTG